MFYAMRGDQLSYIVWLGGLSEAQAGGFRLVEKDDSISVFDSDGRLYAGPLGARDGLAYEFNGPALLSRTPITLTRSKFVERQRQYAKKRLKDFNELVALHH